MGYHLPLASGSSLGIIGEVDSEFDKAAFNEAANLVGLGGAGGIATLLAGGSAILVVGVNVVDIVGIITI